MIKVKKLAFAAFVVATFLLTLLYLPATLVYVISPKQWWVMGILSIGFLYLWMALLAMAGCWFFIRKKVSFTLLLLLLPGVLVLKNVFAMHFPKPFVLEKQKDQIRIMQWNCMGLQGAAPYFTKFTPERNKTVSFINLYRPDIICIQDFSNAKSTSMRSNISLLKDTLGYKYFAFNTHFKSQRPGYDERMGIAIFSKFPICYTGKLNYPDKKVPESILFAGFEINGKQFRVATTHLRSMHLNRDPKMIIEADLSEDSLVIARGTKLEKLRHFQGTHVIEANFASSFLDTCHMPLIFTGDLNSVPSSYVYHIVSKGLTDAFLFNGCGFGRTYDSWQPALRIDYIFCSKAIKLHQTSLFRTTFSDHDPLIMDFSIR